MQWLFNDCDAMVAVILLLFYFFFRPVLKMLSNMGCMLSCCAVHGGADAKEAE
jgi:hypothetical protein